MTPPTMRKYTFVMENNTLVRLESSRVVLVEKLNKIVAPLLFSKYMGVYLAEHAATNQKLCSPCF